MAKFKIAIDAGHGYNTPGKRCPDGTREWSLNSKVANYLQKSLADYDVDVIRLDDTTGKTDVSLLSGRLNKAANAKVDVCLSIHHNAGAGSGYGNYTGVEVLINPNCSSETKKLANAILKELPKRTGLKSRGLKTSTYFTMVSVRSFPTMIIEGGFMNGTNDSKIIKTASYQKGYAKAILNGLLACYPDEIKKKSEEVKVETTTEETKTVVATANAKTTTSTSSKMTATVNLWLRSSAKVTDDNKVTVITKNTEVTVEDKSNKSWYKVKVTKNGKAYSGYCSSSYLK